MALAHVLLIPRFFMDLCNGLLIAGLYRTCMQLMRVGTRGKVAERNCRRGLKGM